MTRRISLIIGIAVAALTVAVPTALAVDRLPIEQNSVEMATPPQQNVAPVSMYRDDSERTGVVVNSGEPQWLKALAARSEGLNRIYGLGQFAGPSQSQELAGPSQSQELKALAARSEGLNRTYGLGEFATTSGRDIEWPQIGVGLGVGIILILGFALVIRSTHTRPFAH